MSTEKPKKATAKTKKTRTLSLSDSAWIRAGVHAKMSGKSVSAMVEEWFLSMPEYEVKTTTPAPEPKKPRKAE